MISRLFRLLIVITTISVVLPGCNNNRENIVNDQVDSHVWTKDLVFYELNVRQFSDEGTLNAITARVPELKDLGVDVIWFMPTYPIGEVNRKGPLGSYYSVKDFMGVNPEFGTLDDFKKLVNTIHEAGMYVMMDWVPNHSAWDNRLATEHPDWYVHNENGDFVSPFDWTDVIQFDWSKEGLQEYMLNALLYWVKDIGVDGFRVDHPHVTPAEFWARARVAMEEVKPVIMLAENEDRPEFLENGFDSNYSWELHHMMNQVAQGKNRWPALDNLLNKDIETFGKKAYRLRFITNHDENSWAGTINERMGDAQKAFAIFIYTIPGIPLLYNGQEAGLDKRLKFFERDPIVWKESELRRFYKTLNSLKHDNPALYNGAYGGTFRKLSVSGAADVYAYAREKDNNKVITVINFSTEHATVTLDDQFEGTFRNLFTGSLVNLAEEKEFSIDPWGWVVLVK